jgi:flagellar motor component MotA
MGKQQELDILEMPLEGLAAYWLSIKKIMDTKKGRTIIDEEIAHTDEPYILHLLETVFSALDTAMIRRLAAVKREIQLEDYARKIDLMRLAVFAIASGENPRITLVRMDSKFSVPLMREDKAFDMATAMFDAIKPRGVNLDILLSVDHKLKADRLLVKLLFFVMFARREGKQGLEQFLPRMGSRFFSEGVSLAIDNFEADFLAYHLEGIRDRTVTDTGRKMDMALEMALAIRDKLSYEDIFRIARTYMQ